MKLHLTVLLTVYFTSLLTGFSSAARADELGNFLMKNLATPQGLVVLQNQLGIKPAALNYSLVSESSKVHPATGQLYESVELKSTSGESIKMVVRYPNESKSVEKLPVVFIMSGLFKNTQTLESFGAVGDVILVGLEYGVDSQDPWRMIQEIGGVLPHVPIKAAVAMLWAYQQEWADQQRFSSIGISLGAILMPVSLRIAQAYGLESKSTLLLYGGGKLSDLASHELRNHLGENERRILKDILAIPFSVVEPTLHLPFVKGPFLVVNGTEDSVIPKLSSEPYRVAVPQPKTVVEIEGPHINLDQWDIIRKVTRLCKAWMQSVGAID